MNDIMRTRAKAVCSTDDDDDEEQDGKEDVVT